MGGLQEEIRSLAARLKDLQDTVEAIERQTWEASDTVTELATKVFEVFPPGEEHIRERERGMIHSPRGPEEEAALSHAGTMDDTAKTLDEDIPRPASSG